MKINVKNVAEERRGRYQADKIFQTIVYIKINNIVQIQKEEKLQ